MSNESMTTDSLANSHLLSVADIPKLLHIGGEKMLPRSHLTSFPNLYILVPRGNLVIFYSWYCNCGGNNTRNVNVLCQRVISWKSITFLSRWSFFIFSLKNKINNIYPWWWRSQNFQVPYHILKTEMYFRLDLQLT